jgi:hypothetical protein
MKFSTKNSEKAAKKVIEIKTLRPWVKYSFASLIIVSSYTLLRHFLFKPKPYIVEFDLQKI